LGGPDTLTVIADRANRIRVYVHEYAGLASPDRATSTEGTDRTARASVVTAAPNELLFAFVYSNDNSESTIIAPVGFDVRSTYHGNLTADRVVEGPGNSDAMATAGTGTTSWGMVLAAFKAK
jgi:hypothetical protein